MQAVQHATDGIFCEGVVAVGMATDGLFCLDGSVEITPPGGGGTGPGIGPGALPSPRPSVNKDEPLYLAQALQEDEELIIILKAFVETIRWH